MAETVGSYGAKTHLPQILRQVQAGKEFEMSVRGVAVAKLIPVESVHQQRIGPTVSSKATTDTVFPRACGDSPVYMLDTKAVVVCAAFRHFDDL